MWSFRRCATLSWRSAEKGASRRIRPFCIIINLSVFSRKRKEAFAYRKQVRDCLTDLSSLPSKSARIHTHQSVVDGLLEQQGAAHCAAAPFQSWASKRIAIELKKESVVILLLCGCHWCARDHAQWKHFFSFSSSCKQNNNPSRLRTKSNWYTLSPYIIVVYFGILYQKGYREGALAKTT